MSFKCVYSDVRYQQYLKANPGKGLCLGQSWLWMSDIITGAKDSLAPPNFNQGGVLHAEYALDPGNDSAFYIRKGGELRASTRGKGLVQRNAIGNACSFEMISEFGGGSQGDASLVMTWDVNKKGTGLVTLAGGSEFAHAMALLRLSHMGKKIYLYDPNRGVYEWNQTAGVNLYTDIERFMPTGTSREAFLRCVTMFSRQGLSPLDFNRVIV